MRALPKDVNEAVSSLKSFYWCYEIILSNGEKLFLTSLDKIALHDEVTYSPASGLNIKEGIFNDSAKDHVSIEGIYDSKGICKQADLTNAQVKILMVVGNVPYHLVTYYCTLYTKYDLNFRIITEPESVKYNQTVVNVLSKTCRAKFGDSKCKAEKNLYSHAYNIVNMSVRSFEISNVHKEAGYFIGGDAHISDSTFNAKILNTMGNIIQLDRVIPENFKHLKSAILTAGCDKKFITCCNKFNNAVNFRGEPFIPEYNFLKINR